MFRRKLPFTLALVVAVLSLACDRTANQNASNQNTSTRVSEHLKIAKCTHAIGLCNLPLFISKEDETTKDLGVQIDLINIPNWGDHAANLANGKVDFSVTPFTNVMTAYANGSPIKIVSGSGINGLFLLGSRDIKSANDLRGKKVGTFQADTLEMLLFSYLEKNGLSYKDVEIVYFTDGFELINAFGSGRVDAMTHVEPYATRVVKDFNANKLASGQEIWGGDHPDCVLTASDRIIRDDPELVKSVIFGMLRAQLNIETDTKAAVDKAAGKYYKAEPETILQAAKAQPPGVDIRHKLQFMGERFEDLKKLKYIKKEAASGGLIDFSFLEEVVSKNKDIHDKLRFKKPN